MAEKADGHEELVKVFDTDEESEAMVVRGLLESAGIEAMTQNREAPQDILPGVGGVVVMVRPVQFTSDSVIRQSPRVRLHLSDDGTIGNEKLWRCR